MRCHDQRQEARRSAGVADHPDRMRLQPFAGDGGVDVSYLVVPEDIYIEPREFGCLRDAEEWAAGLCCSYEIREARW